jgi:Tol biopolymer transport system component
VQVSTFPRRTNGISVSDDGTTIVINYDATLDELVIVPTDGGTERSLHTTVSGVSVLSPLLSPDKTQVAYTEGNANVLGFDLMVIPSNGTGTARRASPLRSSTNLLNVSAFSFSPDSRYLAALGDFTVDGNNELHVFDLVMGTTTALVNALNSTAGNNSRDFGWTSTGQVLVRAALNGGPTRLHLCTVAGTCTPLPGTTTTAIVSSLAVSRDGTLAIYASNERGTGAYDLYRVPTAGGTPARIAPDAPSNWRPAADSLVISPNGQWVTAQSTTGAVYVFATAGGSALTPLYTATGTVAVFSPTFSANSGYLAFRADITTNGSYDLYRMADLVTPNQAPVLMQAGDVTELRWTW